MRPFEEQLHVPHRVNHMQAPILITDVQKPVPCPVQGEDGAMHLGKRHTRSGVVQGPLNNGAIPGGAEEMVTFTSVAQCIHCAFMAGKVHHAGQGGRHGASYSGL